MSFASQTNKGAVEALTELDSDMVGGATAAGTPISLPSGGGGVRGIGETFQPNLFTGTANHAVPIAASPGRDGFGPTLSLEYSSGNGNGLFGLGWQISVPRVSRKTEKGLPHYDETDVFILSGAEDLVPLMGSRLDPATGEVSWSPADPVRRGSFVVRRFRPRTESAVARIEQWQHADSGEIHWRVISSSNVTSVYGASAVGRVADADDPTRVYEWLLEEQSDPIGNHVVYEYAGDEEQSAPTEIFDVGRRLAQRYLRRICYGNLPDVPVDLDGQAVTYPDGSPVGCDRGGRRYAFEVVFDYGDWELPAPVPHPTPPPLGELELLGAGVPVRTDRFSCFRPGFEVRTLRRCRRVLMYHHIAELNSPTLVRSTDLAYHDDEATGLSFLSSVTVTGYRREDSGGYAAASMPPVTFAYSEFRPEEQRYQSLAAQGDDLPPAGLDQDQLELVDLFGDGLPDVVQTGPSGLRYWRNLGDGLLDRPRTLDGVPASVSLGARGTEFADLGGDGHADLLVHADVSPGFFEATADGTWRTFTRYEVPTGLDIADPDLRMLDLTGDGISDALLTTEEHFVWFRGLGEQGFGPPQRIPRTHDQELFPDVRFSDASGRVRLADMNGDGLSDIVILHGGRVDYWPNLGYGRFGARVTMGNAPYVGWDFDPRRAFLTDLDGTGCADFVYVESDRVHYWLNQCGNRWSAPRAIAGTPPITQLDSIRFADVFGTGTATLLWSYPYGRHLEGNYKALDFCGGTKPYVLVQMSNNMGATTRVTYTPSTRHFLRDEALGQPWLARLPFPVQVVDKVEVIDQVSRTKLVRCYAYHHGYYDGREREFRGFGRVDQFDTETFQDFAASEGNGDGGFENAIDAFHASPTEVRTWFHTGIYYDPDSASITAATFDDRELTRRFGEEYYSGDPSAPRLAEHVLDATGAPHEAYRALRGAELRKEVYARDGSAAEAHPYEVTETRYRVYNLQPGDGGRQPVFRTLPLETRAYHYERDPADPRITHSMTLEVDAFGNTLRSAMIGYGRRIPDPQLPTEADREAQARTVATYTEKRYTNVIDDLLSAPDDFRTPLPCETKTFELTGYAPANGTHFSVEELMADDFARLDNAPDLAYEATPDPAVEQKRLIEHVRVRFRRDNLQGLLPLGSVQPLALAGRTAKLALTPGLVDQIYGSRVTDDILSTDAGYIHTEGDDQWWIPSERVFYSAVESDSPAAELAVARAHFFRPRRSVNPFGGATTMSYDAYDLLLRQTVDALGNTSTAEHDYRVLQPARTTDANGNRSEAAFDTLGLVVGTAVKGKPGEGLGDTLSGFTADLTEAQVDAFVADPTGQAATLLAGATTRVVHDLHRFRRTGQPIVAASVVRATHVGEPSSAGVLPDLSLRYSDGFGREVQSKMLVEPGPALPGGAVISPRWRGSGATVFDNKSRPVRQFESFFDDTSAFRPGHRIGVSSALLRDAAGRVVVTLHPDHSWAKLVVGAWREESWDVNDTVLVLDPANDPDVGALFGRLPPTEYLPTWHAQRASGALGPEEQDAAAKTAEHAATPRVTHADSLGRTFLTLAHNRFERGGALVEERYATRVLLDVEGNHRAVVDANDRVLMRYDYDMLGSRVHQAGMDAGERWTLLDVLGQPAYAWDSRGHRSRHVFDALRRPSEQFVLEPGADERLVVRTRYGEASPSPEAANLRGRVAQVFDEAGVVHHERYDFKGNLLVSRRQFAADYAAQVDWQAPPGLEPSSFTTASVYDAQNRVVAVTTPDGSELRPTYHLGGTLQAVHVGLHGEARSTPFVTDIDYDVRGRRTRVVLGNGVETAYEFDPTTLRLTRLTTALGPRRFQDLAYTYDAAGHVVHVADDAQQPIFFANQVVPPDSSYTYDAVYRLVAAEGREHVGQASGPQTTWDDRFRTGHPHPGDGQAMQRYAVRYDYDPLGNLVATRHTAAQGSWTRAFRYQEPSLLEPNKQNNRLSSTELSPTLVEQYAYDAHANLVSTPHLPDLVWGHRDELRSVNLGGGGTAFYVYDASGQRVRKVVERNGGALVEERLYIAGFEVFRRRVNGALRLERETLHVTAGNLRVALVETRTQGTDDAPAQLTRYQCGNSIGSTCLELDEAGRVISYEEYFPYGSTAYQAVRSQTDTPKRYRFTGMERDEETGFQYHTLRYYAPWLSRWTSADPLGISGGLNLFGYAAQDPIGHADPTGTEPTIAEVQAFTRRADVDRDHVISLRELSNALQCTEKITARSWFASTIWLRGYRMDKDLQKLSAAYAQEDWDRRARELERFYESDQNTLQLDKHGMPFTKRTRREAGQRWLNRHRDPKRLLPIAALGASIVFPEAMAVLAAWDTGVKTGETLTATRSGVRVWDIMTGNVGVAGTKMTDAEHAATAKDAAMGWAAIGVQFILTRPPRTPDGPPQIVFGDVKSLNSYEAGLKHVSLMEGRGVYNTNGNVGLALYDPNDGAVFLQVFGPRTGSQARTIIWEGQIGKIDIPKGLTPTQIGNEVEEAVRNLVGRATGQSFPTKAANAHGPDLHIPAGR